MLIREDAFLCVLLSCILHCLLHSVPKQNLRTTEMRCSERRCDEELYKFPSCEKDFLIRSERIVLQDAPFLLVYLGVQHAR